MKKSFSLFLVIFGFFLFLSCSNNDEVLIKQTVKDYQAALNTNDSQKLIELFESPKIEYIKYASELLNTFYEMGMKPEYTIDIIELTINDNIAEARLKTTIKYIGNDKDQLDLLSYFEDPVKDSVMTLRKNNETWKILAEMDIE